MENKKYWLRGLITGIVFYVLFLLITYILLMVLSGGGAGSALFNGIQVIAVYIFPIIPLGIFVGWIYGKTPKIAILISVLILFLMICLEVIIVKNTIYSKPYSPQPGVYNGQPYTPKPSLYR